VAATIVAALAIILLWPTRSASGASCSAGMSRLCEVYVSARKTKRAAKRSTWRRPTVRRTAKSITKSPEPIEVSGAPVVVPIPRPPEPPRKPRGSRIAETFEDAWTHPLRRVALELPPVAPLDPPAARSRPLAGVISLFGGSAALAVVAAMMIRRRRSSPIN